MLSLYKFSPRFYQVFHSISGNLSCSSNTMPGSRWDLHSWKHSASNHQEIQLRHYWEPVVSMSQGFWTSRKSLPDHIDFRKGRAVHLEPLYVASTW